MAVAIVASEATELVRPTTLPMLSCFLRLLGTMISQPGSICFLPLPFTWAIWPFM